MRLWHYQLLPYLPNSQLIAQWRELNCMYSKQVNHLLINYAYKYKKENLKSYSDLVIKELARRRIKVLSFEKYDEYFKYADGELPEVPFPEHDDTYLRICFYNLMEKYMRGQKDFTDEAFDGMKRFVRERLAEKGKQK